MSPQPQAKDNVLIQNTQPQNNAPDFWNKIKFLFTNHQRLGETIKQEDSIKEGLIAIFMGAALYTLGTFGTYFLTNMFAYDITMFAYDITNYGMIPDDGFVMPLAYFLLIIMESFIGSGLLHLMIMMLKGEGNFAKTYNVYGFSVLIPLAIGYIPLINFVGVIYACIIQINSLSVVHNISKGKAALAVFIPIVALIILVVGIVSTFLLTSGLI